MTTPLQQAFRFTTPSNETRPVRSNLVIEAGAGTGKTSKIVAEVLKLLLDNEDLSPDRIVLMTFTEKAAGEIADRIHQALAELELHFDDERVVWPIGSARPLFEVPAGRKEAYGRACRKQVTRIDAIRSQTIHSFCQSLLRSYPIEAGLDPQFKIIEGFERSLLYGQLYDAWLDEETRTNSTEQTLRQWEFLIAHVGYLFQIRALVFSLLARRDLLNEPDFDFGDFDEIEEEIRGALTVIRRSDISRSVEPAGTIFRYVQQVDPPENGSLDAWIDYFAPIAPAIEEARVPTDRDLKEALMVLRTDRAKGTSIYDRLVRHRSAIAIHALTRRFIDFLDREKRTLGVADFDDLLLRTVALLDNKDVLERVRQQFDYMFVDEFQDTDRTQARIIDRLARDRKGSWVPGKLVVVGDPKQSIYGFRRADPETYRGMTSQMIAAGADPEVLRDQFRSDAPLLDAINTIFDAVFANGGPPDPNVFRPQYHELVAAKQKPERDLDARITCLQATHVSEAEAIAEFIGKNRDGSERDLQRFAILFRRMTILDDYLDTFDRYGIDYVLPPTKAFLERRAPVDLLAVLRAVGFPFDMGAEISAARTPYFALTDQEIAEGVIGETPGFGIRDSGFVNEIESRIPNPESRTSWLRFREALEAYRQASSHLTVSGTIDLLIRSAGIEQIYAATSDGHRAARHLEHIRALAFEYDQKIGGSVRQFVEEIDRRRVEPDETEPSLADDDSNAIRILTVHAAKGLEFETVILPDLGFKAGSDGLQLFTVEEPRSVVMTGRAQSLSAHYRNAGPGRRLRKILDEREEAEMRRLFYVAVTRAKTDVVFVCNGASFKKGTFFGCLGEAFCFDKDSFEGLFPPGEGRVVRTQMVGVNAVPVAFESVRAGLQMPAGGRRPPLRDEALATQLANGEIVPLDLAQPAGTPTFTPAEAAIGRARSRNRKSGILLHRFLEQWDGTTEADQLLRRLASEAAASEQTVATVRRRVAKLRHSSTLKRIVAAETIDRELPIRFLENGESVERRIDRLISENGTEVVIDYKSGSPDQERLAVDREQVAQYCKAVEALTGRPCRGLLWYIEEDLEFTVQSSQGSPLNCEL